MTTRQTRAGEPDRRLTQAERVTRRLDERVKLLRDGAIMVRDAAAGVVLPSANGHFWRLTVSNAGALVIDDLGTDTPA